MDPFALMALEPLRDAAIAPLDEPMVDVVATAKVDLRRGDDIDAIGGYLTYGEARNRG